MPIELNDGKGGKSMCGIAGYVNLPIVDTDNMLSTMKRRGPDSVGTFMNKNVCLLHARLAIIDIEGGRQPMTIQTDKDTYTIVYNGE